MVNKCSFPNCRSGYDVISKGVNKARTIATMHKFPNELKDHKRFEIWKNSPVDRISAQKKDLYLCSLHFDAQYKKPTGEISDRPRLTANAIPTVSDVCRSVTVITPEKEQGGIALKIIFQRSEKIILMTFFLLLTQIFLM